MREFAISKELDTQEIFQKSKFHQIKKTLISVGTEGAIFMWHMPAKVFEPKDN